MSSELDFGTVRTTPPLSSRLRARPVRRIERAEFANGFLTDSASS
jgi:hypothetical protein